MSPHQINTAGIDQVDFWRSIVFFNIYRCIIAVALFSYYFIPKESYSAPNSSPELYLKLALAYLLLSFSGLALSWLRKLHLKYQLSAFTIADIIFIVTLTYAAGGLKTGLGLLLVIAIALASLLSQGRLALFYAALASIALLLEQTYQAFSWNESFGDYSHAVILSISCFATAWLAHSLAKRTVQSEALASQRSIDLENLAQINTLITQEMQDGVLVVDKDFVVRHQNDQAEGLLGIAAQAWQARSLFNCAPELASIMRTWVNDASPEAASGLPIKLSATDRELRIRFMPIAQSRSEGAVIFIEDWSQIQTQSQQVKLAALGRLTANIAHEIRNPLSAISHATQLLQEEDFEPANQRMLQIIADNVQRLDQIVKDVLELNRRDRTLQENIGLSTFLSEFHEQFCQAEKIPLLGLKLNLPAKEVFINFDKRHLNQILWNLCRNGWRHSQQAEASVNITTLATAGNTQAILEVTDDGSGIPADVASHLFEPFFTTESTGTGLGLYIARELCQANGARIQYSALTPGAKFTIHMKRAVT